MRVTHRMLAHGVTRNLKQNMRNLSIRSNQLSTGRIFDRPSQDPVGTYKVMRLAGTALARNAQYCRNIGEGISWLSATEDALAGTIDTVQRLRELSVYAANEIFTAADRLAVAPEVRQLLEHLISIGNTELAGLYLFGGHRTDEKPFALAGETGAMLQTWLNPAGGLLAGADGGIGLKVENLAAGSYAVSTERTSLSYVQGRVTSGPGGQAAEVTLEFTVDGDAYTVTAAGADDDVPGAIANIIAAVASHPVLSLYLAASGVDTTGDSEFDSVRFVRTDIPEGPFSLAVTPTDPEIFQVNCFTGPTVTVVSQYLQAARAGFFGTDRLELSYDSTAALGGSVALEIVEAVRHQDLRAELQEQIDGEPGDRIVRLAVRYLLRDVEGRNYEGSYGQRSDEDIYLNLNRLYLGEQLITFQTGGGDVSLGVSSVETLTFEHDLPLVGDKLVLQLKPPAAYSSTEEFDRFTLHRDYGRPDASGRPTVGAGLDWYFARGVFDPDPPAEAKNTTLKFFDIDHTNGKLITSTIQATFRSFGTAAAQEYRSQEEILRYGVPDEEYDSYPAAIFNFIAAGEPYFLGDGGERLLEIAPGNAVPANMSGLYLFDLEGKDGVGLFRAVNRLYEALLHNDREALGGPVLQELDRYFHSLLKHRSELGARMERFLVTEEQHRSEHIFLRELRSKLEDIDMAEIITEFTLQETVYQAALATGARMIYPSLVDFLR